MIEASSSPAARSSRGSLAGAALLALPACQSTGQISFVEAIRRLLVLSSQRAFVRLNRAGRVSGTSRWRGSD